MGNWQWEAWYYREAPSIWMSVDHLWYPGREGGRVDEMSTRMLCRHIVGRWVLYRTVLEYSSRSCLSCNLSKIGRGEVVINYYLSFFLIFATASLPWRHAHVAGLKLRPIRSITTKKRNRWLQSCGMSTGTVPVNQLICNAQSNCKHSDLTSVMSPSPAEKPPLSHKTLLSQQKKRILKIPEILATSNHTSMIPAPAQTQV